MCCGTEAGSYLRLTDSCITQLKAQGPSNTCNESEEEEEELERCARAKRPKAEGTTAACLVPATLETSLGQMAPPKSGRPLRMPPDSGGILRGCPLLGVAIFPNVVSRAEAPGNCGHDGRLPGS